MSVLFRLLSARWYRPGGILCLLLLLTGQWIALAANDSSFASGVAAYEAGRFAVAARDFRNSTTNEPATGAFLNLGLSEWRRGRAGTAICAWEQALWISLRSPYGLF